MQTNTKKTCNFFELVKEFVRKMTVISTIIQYNQII